MKKNMEHNEFVGNFDNFFDNESSYRATGVAEMAEAINFLAIPTSTTTTPAPVVPKYRCKTTPPYFVRDDINGTVLAANVSKCPRPVIAGSNTSSSSTGTGSSSSAGTSSEGGGTGTTSTTTTQVVPKYRCKTTSPYFVRDDVNGTVLAANVKNCPKPVIAGSNTSSSSTATGTTDTGTTSTGSTMVDMSSGGEQPVTEEQQTEQSTEQVKTTTTTTTTIIECKLNYTPIIIFIAVCVVAAYMIAKQQGKDIKQFGVVGAIIGGIIGYVYVKHQCTPVEALSKIGIKSGGDKK